MVYLTLAVAGLVIIAVIQSLYLAKLSRMLELVKMASFAVLTERVDSGIDMDKYILVELVQASKHGSTVAAEMLRNTKP